MVNYVLFVILFVTFNLSMLLGNYQVGDKFSFDPSEATGSGAAAKVQRIAGKEIITTSSSFPPVSLPPSSLGLE